MTKEEMLAEWRDPKTTPERAKELQAALETKLQKQSQAKHEATCQCVTCNEQEETN